MYTEKKGDRKEEEEATVKDVEGHRRTWRSGEVVSTWEMRIIKDSYKESQLKSESVNVDRKQA